MNTPYIAVQEQMFDLPALLAQLHGRQKGRAGAYVHFLGSVRDFSPAEPSSALYLEHYPGMCERELQALCRQAADRWNILDIVLIHRVGHLDIGEPIVFVAVAAVHRQDAFRACEFIIDTLKTKAPFWKRETLRNGRSFWVEQSSADAEKTALWEHG